MEGCISKQRVGSTALGLWQAIQTMNFNGFKLTLEALQRSLDCRPRDGRMAVGGLRRTVFRSATRVCSSKITKKIITRRYPKYYVLATATTNSITSSPSIEVPPCQLMLSLCLDVALGWGLRAGVGCWLRQFLLWILQGKWLKKGGRLMSPIHFERPPLPPLRPGFKP